MSDTYSCKKAVYDQPEFLDAVRVMHLDKSVHVLPFIIGARYLVS